MATANGLLQGHHPPSLYQGLGSSGLVGGGSGGGSTPPHQRQGPPDSRRLLNGWNYGAPAPPEPPSSTSHRPPGCNNFSPYAGPLGPAGPAGGGSYPPFPSGADFLQHQFGSPHRSHPHPHLPNLSSFYGDLYGHHHHQPSPGSAHPLFSELGSMPTMHHPRFETDVPLTSFIGDVSSHNPG